MDLMTILPAFPTEPFIHILPSLERKQITTADLITLDSLEIAKRAHIPPADVRRLCADVIIALQRDLGFQLERHEIGSRTRKEDRDLNLGIEEQAGPWPYPFTKLDLECWATISTLDSALDKLLDGGIPTRYLTEVTGESGSGKTQFLLSLLLAVQLPRPQGLGKRAIYISTEAPLPTTRLSQLLNNHPCLATLSAGSRPLLANVFSINAIDLESQDHILNYQLPVAVSRYNVGLVVIDSIAANYRAERASNTVMGVSARSGELTRLGQMLRNLAAQENVAVVVANQVTDKFSSSDDDFPESQVGRFLHHQQEFHPFPAQPAPAADGETTRAISVTPDKSPSPYVEDGHPDSSYIVGHPVRNECLRLVHQQRFFTGWGDAPDLDVLTPQRAPALGFVWSTQIACRIALKKEDRKLVSLENSAHLGQLHAAISRDSRTQIFGEESSIARDIRISNEDRDQTDSIRTAPVEKHDDQPKTKMAENQSILSPKMSERRMRRKMKLVFAPWTAGAAMCDKLPDDEIEFEIWEGGIRSVPSST